MNREQRRKANRKRSHAANKAQWPGDVMPVQATACGLKNGDKFTTCIDWHH